MSDISSFDRQTAEAEVDKLLLDAEMVNMYIQFQKEKEKDPDFKVPELKDEDEGFFSFNTILYAYFGYFAFTSGTRFFRNYVAEQQAAGTWKGTNIPFIDDWITNTAPAVIQPSDAVDVAASTVADSLQAVSDAVQSSA